MSHIATQHTLSNEFQPPKIAKRGTGQSIDPLFADPVSGTSAVKRQLWQTSPAIVISLRKRKNMII
jgi:hypothetical protein